MRTMRADSIVEELENMIITGKFADGDRLDEASLSTRFGVSRTPLRQALQKLVATGLVVHIPHRGVFVHQPGPVAVIEMFELMAELEAVCGRLAARRISTEALDELRVANRKCAEAVKAGNADAYYRKNECFHHILYKQSGNDFIAQETRRLQKRLRPFRRMQLHLRGRMVQSMSEHEAIVTALTEGNAERASEALRDHVAVQGDKFFYLVKTMKEAAADLAPEPAPFPP